MESKTLVLVVGALAVWFLFFRRPSAGGTAKPQYRPYAPPTVAQQVTQGAATVLPALGSFLGNLGRSGVFSGGSSSSSDDLMTPSFFDSDTSSVAFTDENALDYSF